MRSIKRCSMQLPRKYQAIFYSIICLASMNKAHAVACTVGTTTVGFGVYDVFSNQDTDATGTVTVTCDPDTTPYTIALERGITGSINNRVMLSASGHDRLNYNLYIDAARSTIWGNGSGNSLVVSQSAPATVTVYGRIPPGQNVSVGTYSDTVSVTISF